MCLQKKLLHILQYIIIQPYGFDVNKCTKRNDHWLGRGIYFFTEKEFAEWWVDKKSDMAILSCSIVCDDERVLNLDNFMANFKFQQKCKEYELKYKPAFKNENQYRATMIELYKSDYDVDVIIYTFEVYGGTFYQKHLLDKEISKSMKLFLPQKQICVNNVSVISNIKEE